jgi:hypothetical protein
MNGQDTIAYASAFTGSLSLWLAVLIGVIASVLVLRSAHKMGGGLFGSVLNLIGIGMLIVALGTTSIIVESYFPSDIISLIHTVFFSVGYICMVLGANKLLKGIMQ